MKAKEFKEWINTIPDDYDIVLSCDAEGNEYSPVSGGGEAMYEPETKSFGFCRCKEDVEEDGEIYKPNALVLYPLN